MLEETLVCMIEAAYMAVGIVFGGAAATAAAAAAGTEDAFEEEEEAAVAVVARRLRRSGSTTQSNPRLTHRPQGLPWSHERFEAAQGPQLLCFFNTPARSSSETSIGVELRK
jgi:hypothetical protein